MPNTNNPPGGAVTLTGNAVQYQTLTAASTLTDADGLGPILWQWQRLVGATWADIPGQNDPSYTLVQADVGATLRAVASYTDQLGTAESVASAPSAAVQNVNDPPAGEVTINGAAALQGTVLTASAPLTDPDGIGPIAFSWQRDGAGGWTTIAGANQASYTLVQADVGHTVRALASYTDQQGTAESVASSPTAPVGNVNDAPTGGLTVPGIARQGQALTVVSTVADADGLGTPNYRWQRDNGVAGWNDIAGANAATYTPVQADVGHGLRAVLSYTDLYGTDESLVSAATPAVANVNDAPTGTLAIIGTAAQNQVLTLLDTLDDPDGMGDPLYVWQRSDGHGGWITIPRATGDSYVPGQADVGFALRAVASYTDGLGTGETAPSAATAPVANANDAPTGSVTIAGTPVQNQLLTAANTLADIDGLGVITYSWQRYDGVATWSTIAGATASRYAPVQADVGRYLRAVASYVDGFGTTERVASDATDFVANVNDPATGTLTLAGTPTQNQRLTATIAISDPDGVGPYVPQWQRLDGLAGWLDIPGATGTSYTLVQGDVGTRVRVTAAFTDLQGTDESVSSAPSGLVANINDPPTGTVTIAGLALLGRTLLASDTLDDADGRGDVAYAWQRGDGRGGWTAIPGATTASYVVATADLGLPLRVVGSYTDFFGTNESVASASTGAAASIPPEWQAAARLFDPAFYLANYPDIAAAGVNPFAHYMASGWREGRDPSALFHTAYYLNQNPDLVAAGVNPLAHFAGGGWAEGRDPSIGFSVGRYLQAYPDIRAMAVDPVEYHMTTGRAEGRQAFAATPHPTAAQDLLVDAAWYYAQHPDVAAAGLDATTHYQATGWRAGFDPNPWFHTTFYLNQNPDIRAAGIDPLAHFEASGWREGRDPSAGFSLSGYLAAYPDIRAAGLNPLAHFVANGRFEGRQAFAATPHATGPRDPLVDPAKYYAQQPAAAIAGLDASADFHANGWRTGALPDDWFDTGYYLAQNPDIRAAGIDPLAHYETNGWREGRLPSLLFSPAKYLVANPDVAAAGIDPLAHYVASGRFEGRQAALPGGTAPADPLVDAAYYDHQLGASLIPTGAAAQQQAAWSYDSTGWQRGLKPDAWFDTNYYLSHNPDVAAAHINPLLHYENSGWREGRDPSAAFSTNGYLNANPDVRAAAFDPLLHFVVNGQYEGRVAIPV